MSSPFPSTRAASRDVQSSPTLLASSAIKKSGTSITLPRNFAPLSLDPTASPRTPDQTFAQLVLPPPPPRSTYRIRRPRINLENFSSRNATLSATLFASEISIPSSAGPLTTEFSASSIFGPDRPLPSVESTATPTRPTLQLSHSEPLSSARLQLPKLSPFAPQTPSSQTMKTPIEIKREEWNMQRASSVCSQHSNSSLSSAETYETRPTSFDGSVTSPDLESDPFSQTTHTKVIQATPSRKTKKQRLASFFSKDNALWTIDMDNHLFNVYQMYLADPTVTPFKTVPGSIPPTGVCHRVARRARETWSHATRIKSPIIKGYKVRSLLDVSSMAREKTPDPDNFLGTSSQDDRPRWPGESATRRRLKQLCREKFTISAHYNRLRQSRSPSPFAEQFVVKKPSSATHSPRFDDETAYETRKLHIDLVSTGVTGPLAQLTTGDSPEPSALETFNQEADTAEIKRLSSPMGLGIQQEKEASSLNAAHLAPMNDIPRLASPFAYNTWNGPVRPEPRFRKQISQNHYDTVHATGPRLQSPFRPDLDLGANINKRRAQHNLEDELSPSGSSLAGHTLALNLDEPSPMQVVKEEPPQDLIFSGLGEIGQRRVRLRNRGATLGSAHERIAKLFAPLNDEDVPPVPALPAQYAAGSLNSSLAPPKVDEAQKRLGSPFELDPNRRSLRSKPPRHLPSLSDPFISFTHGVPSVTNAQSNIGNIGERLANFEEAFGEQQRH